MYKKYILTTLIIFTISSSWLLAQGQGRGRNRGPGINNGGTCVQMVKQDLNEKEKAALIYMREEEKLAHDVYSKLFEKWDFSTF